MDDDTLHALMAVSHMQVLTGAVPSVEFVYTLQHACGTQLQRSVLQQFEEVFLVIAVLESAFDKMTTTN